MSSRSYRKAMIKYSLSDAQLRRVKEYIKTGDDTILKLALTQTVVHDLDLGKYLYMRVKDPGITFRELAAAGMTMGQEAFRVKTHEFYYRLSLFLDGMQRRHA